MLSAQELQEQQSTNSMKVVDLFKQDLPEEDTEDRDFQPMVNDQGVVVTEAEQDEEEEEDEDEEEENVEDDEELSDDEVKDIVLESLQLQAQQTQLRNGKMVEMDSYRESTIMADFEDEEEDGDYHEMETEEADEEDDDDDEVEEDDDEEDDAEEEELSDDEVSQIVTGISHVASDKLLNPIKTLRHGKVVSKENSDDMVVVTDKIRSLMQAHQGEQLEKEM